MDKSEMQYKVKDSKAFGLLLFFGVYIIAYALGFLVGTITDNFVWKMLLFDLVATVTVWVVSLFFHNSSLYDAYWSLTPMIMLFYGATKYVGLLNGYHYIFIAVFMIWSARLTINWVITFENLKWEDWRYKRYRELPPIAWQLANFFGIMLIPTLLVFLGMLPLFYFLTLSATPLSLIGSAIILLGATFEFFADRQMHRFLKQTTERKTCQTGLWKYSRHPNYFGEILIWVGVYVSLICTDISLWYLFGGVVAMIFLFLVISIPLAEKRQLARRNDYREYREMTSKLVPLPKKRGSSN